MIFSGVAYKFLLMVGPSSLKNQVIIPIDSIKSLINFHRVRINFHRVLIQLIGFLLNSYL